MSLDLTPIVDIEIANNVTWDDAFQFGTPGDTSWSFTGKHFRLDVKANKDDVVALLSLSSSGATIVVTDAAQRILQFNVPYTTIEADLPVLPNDGHYFYDLIMIDDGSGQRDGLMRGKFEVEQGVTGA